MKLKNWVALSVGDNAIIVVNAKEGVESSTENTYKEISLRKIPTIFFINTKSMKKTPISQLFIKT